MLRVLCACPPCDCRQAVLAHLRGVVVMESILYRTNLHRRERLRLRVAAITVQQYGFNDCSTVSQCYINDHRFVFVACLSRSFFKRTQRDKFFEKLWHVMTGMVLFARMWRRRRVHRVGP